VSERRARMPGSTALIIAAGTKKFGSKKRCTTSSAGPRPPRRFRHYR
jgi:hypothetical protein